MNNNQTEDLVLPGLSKHDFSEYNEVHQNAKRIIELAGDGVRYHDHKRKPLVDLSQIPDQVFDGERVYGSVSDLETVLYQTYHSVAPAHQLTSTTHQHDLSRIITGDGIIEFLVYDAGFDLADAYVSALRERVETKSANYWPLSTNKMQGRINSKTAINRFKSGFDEYQVDRNPTALAKLFKNSPRLSRGYTALVAREISKFSGIDLTPFYRHGHGTLRAQVIKSGKKILKLKATSPKPQSWPEHIFDHKDPLLLTNEANSNLIEVLARTDLDKLKIQYLKHLAHVEVTRNLYQERFTPFAMSEAKKWYDRIGDEAKTNASAIDGLEQALMRFDYDRGLRFTTHATWWLRQNLHRTFDSCDEVRVPVHIKESNRIINSTIRYLRTKGIRDPTNEDIANFLEKDPKKIEESRRFGNNTKLLHLDKPVNDDHKSNKFSDFIKNKESPSPDIKVIESEIKKSVDDLLSDYSGIKVGLLDDREIDIIKKRYGIDQVNGQTRSLEDIGTDYNLTRERIRQIELRAIRKLKKICEKPDIQKQLLPLIMD